MQFTCARETLKNIQRLQLQQNVIEQALAGIPAWEHRVPTLCHPDISEQNVQF